MKKIMASGLAAAMVLSMVGCGTSANTASSATNDTATGTTATAEGASAETALPPTVLNTDTNTLSINLASEPDYLDPALNSSVDGACLAVNSFSGLMTYDEKGALIPAIASSYDVSEDKLTYTFHLIDSKWSDGTPLTANDFVYSWNRAANPMTASDYSYLYDGLIAKNEAAAEQDAEGNYTEAAKAAQTANTILEGVTALDDSTLEVTLVSPCPYFLSLCAFPTFYPVPQAAVEAANPDGTQPGAWCAEAGFVSNGAYTCTTWKHDESMTYTKNPNYYDAANVSVENLQFMLSAQDTAIYSAYNSGNLDFIDTVPTDEIANLNGKTPEFYIAPNLGTYYVGFNVTSKIFDGKTPEQANAMRKAMNLLIDREYIVESIAQTGQELANTFIPPSMSDGNGGEFRQNTDAYTYPDKDALGYFDPSYDAYDANLTEAVELLKSAGYEFDGDVLSANTPISFTYLTNNGTAHEKIAQAIQQDLAVVGITVDIKSEEWNVFLDDRKAGNFDVAREGWLADFDDPVNMLEMWITDSGNNDCQYGRGPGGKGDTSAAPAYAPQDWNKYDELIDSIKAETDMAARSKMMHEAEDMVMENYAIVPLYYYNDIYMQKPNVDGIYCNVYGFKYFQHATKTAA